MGITKEDKINLYYPMLYRYVVIRMENETEAIEYIPYDVTIPTANYDVVIAVQMDNYFHVGARYAVSDLSEFTIRYNFFKNSNWEMEYRYNGDIHVIAFDDSMVQLEFKNMETYEMHEILDQFNFSE